jgi:hypothetical protein
MDKVVDCNLWKSKTLEEVSKLEFKKEFFAILSEKERRLFATHQSLPPIISSTPGTSIYAIATVQQKQSWHSATEVGQIIADTIW